MSTVKFENYSFTYAGSKENVLKGINLEIEDGKIIVLCGKSGCGKTTLLKMLIKEIAPVGEHIGALYCDIESKDISIVFQNPESQLVCGDVIHDLVFQMENLGFEQKLMKKRLAETVCFFGIEELLHRNPESLSGGQKQLIALCAALMTHPKLLILDEPLSQLDPISAINFLDTLKRINEEFSVTIIMSEHRINDCIGLADYLAIMEEGKLIYCAEPKEVIKKIWEQDDNLKCFIPDITKSSLKLYNKVVFTPREFKPLIKNVDYKHAPEKERESDILLNIKNVVYSYPGMDSHVLKRLSLEITKQDLTCIFGGNGSGKSTLLKLIVGVNKGFLGSIKKPKCKICYMPQNVYTYFSSDTVKKEIVFDGYDEEYYTYLTKELKIGHLEKRHPFDISSGEAGRIVIASILLQKPDLIVLDEPTKGLDGELKEVLYNLLKQSNATIIMATHDLEFAAAYSDRCVMLFDGDIAYSEQPHKFFEENRYYTTAINKGFRHVCSEIITYKDVLKL